MADLSKEEFAAMCRTTVAVLNTNIQRNKIIYDKRDKKIDSDDPINKAFFKNYFNRAPQNKPKTAKPERQIETLYDDVVEKVSKSITKVKLEEDKNERKSRTREKSQATVDWQERKIKADALLQEAKAKKEELNLQKLAGKLIPVDLVFNILNIHNHDIFATFQNDAENLASIYCDILAGGDRKKLSEVTEKISERLNAAIKRAKEVSVSSLEIAIDEYSEVRSRGEKK